MERFLCYDRRRNELTDEWHQRGAKVGVEYAILTNEISQGTFDLSIQAYKHYKVLPAKENLRDHMTTIELVLCSLGEATATLYHRNRDSQGFPALKRDATDAGITAGKARRIIEEDTGQSIVSPENHLELKKGKGKKLSGSIATKSKDQKRLNQKPQLSLFDEPTQEN